MRTLEELLNLVPKYLNGLLSKGEMQDFEQGIRIHPILKREIEEMKELQAAIAIADRYDDGHIDQDILIQSVFSPQLLSEVERSKIAEHTAACSRCRENEELAKSSFRAVNTRESHFLSTIVSDLKSWLERYTTFASPVLTPAIAAVVILLLAIPAFYGAQSFWQSGDGMKIQQIQQLGTRAGSEVETVRISSSEKILRLDVLVPVQDDGVYDFYFKTTAEKTVVSLHGLQPKEPMSIEIPTAYLESAEYVVSFEELLPGQQVASVVTKFPIKILISK